MNLYNYTVTAKGICLAEISVFLTMIYHKWITKSVINSIATEKVRKKNDTSVFIVPSSIFSLLNRNCVSFISVRFYFFRFFCLFVSFLVKLLWQVFVLSCFKTCSLRKTHGTF